MTERVERQVSDGRLLGRYLLCAQFASGGMATIHFGRLCGERGFSRTVAIKRLQPAYARDLRFVTMLTDEARLTARVQHPNVVAPLDVVVLDDEELLLVMEYVHGESLARLLRACAQGSVLVRIGVVANVMLGVLHGLHAAHQAVSDRGHPLGIVHRDVSPQNILVGADGVTRVIDFGLARASQICSPLEPSALGKLSYMAPEQLCRRPFDRRSDVFSAGIVLWEMLTQRRLYTGKTAGAVARKIVEGQPPAPSRWNPQVTRGLDAVVARALARDPEERFPSAWAFAQALEQSVWPASARLVGEWVRETAGEGLARRAELRARIESASSLDGARRAPGRPAPERIEAPPIAPGPDQASPGINVGAVAEPPRYAAPSFLAEPSVSTAVLAQELERRPTPPGGIRRSLRRGVIALGLSSVAFALVFMTSTHRGDRVKTAIPERALAPRPGPIRESTDDRASEIEKLAQPPAAEPPVQRVRPRRRTNKPSISIPARAAERCRPPYRVDARGIRRIPPGCPGGKRWTR